MQNGRYTQTNHTRASSNGGFGKYAEHSRSVSKAKGKRVDRADTRQYYTRKGNGGHTINAVAADYERYLEKLFAVLLQYDDYINGSTTATDAATGESAIVAEEYHGIKAAFRKYIVDTPEEVSEVLARKVSANLMSIFAAVREQHPDWSDDAIYKERYRLYAR